MTSEDVQEGLADVTAVETALSDIDGQAGELYVRGFPIAELARNATFEETVYLLYEGRLPTAGELETFRDRLTSYRSLPEPTREVVVAAAESGAEPMAALRAGAASATLDTDGTDPREDALRLVARLPTIVATYWRVRNGEAPLDPRADLGHAANYLYLLTGEDPTDAEIRGLETYLSTVVDHGLNASTFTARTIVSTRSDLVSAVTGAIGALKGDLHGGAPDLVLDMLCDLREADDVEANIRERVASGDRLMGFGHRVYDTRDPRAKVLSAAAEQFYSEDDDFFELAKRVERSAVDILREYKPDHPLETNVEFYTAVLLFGVGVPRELYTPTFAVARVAGWTAHCMEQLSNNRLIRPRSKYVGEHDRTWTPIDER